jgi:hypothetical protein
VNTSGTGWANDLIFDFANATISGTNNTVSATGNYSRLTIFIDPGLKPQGPITLMILPVGLKR